MYRLRWRAFAMAVAVSGCSSPITQWELTPLKPLTLVHIEHAETIVVVFKGGTGPDGPLPVNQEAQKAIESCIKDGLRKVKSTLVLSDLNHSQVRYRIDLRVHISFGAADRVREPGGGFAIARDKRTYFEADVHDVKHNQAVGRLVVGAVGIEGGGISPALVPVIRSASTEPAACRHFGELLGRRIVPGDGNTVPTDTSLKN